MSAVTLVTSTGIYTRTLQPTMHYFILMITISGFGVVMAEALQETFAQEHPPGSCPSPSHYDSMINCHSDYWSQLCSATVN